MLVILKNTKVSYRTSGYHISLVIQPMGIDLLSLFPIASSQLKYVVIVVDYFTKYIEIEQLATITSNNI